MHCYFKPLNRGENQNQNQKHLTAQLGLSPCVGISFFFRLTVRPLFCLSVYTSWHLTKPTALPVHAVRAGVFCCSRRGIHAGSWPCISHWEGPVGHGDQHSPLEQILVCDFQCQSLLPSVFDCVVVFLVVLTPRYRGQKYLYFSS